MPGEIDYLHHIGLFAEDSEAAFAAYERLGFVLTPLSRHKGADRPGAPLRLLGSANRCAVFDGGYLEITARIGGGEGDDRHRGRSGFLDRYEGLHIICLGADDMVAVERRLAKLGFETSGVAPLERDVETPDGVRTARFERVRMASDGSHSREHLQIANHLTPELIFQPRYMDHANGAVALTEVMFCVADPDEYEARYTTLTGRAAERRGAARVIALPKSRIAIVAADDLMKIIPGATAPALPFMAGFTVAVRDMDRVKTMLSERGVTPCDSGGRLMVPARDGSGATVIFEAA